MFGRSLKKQAVSVDLAPVNNALKTLSNNIGYKNDDDSTVRDMLLEIKTKIAEVSGGSGAGGGVDVIDTETKNQIKLLYEMMFTGEKSLYNTIGYVGMPENYPGAEETIYAMIKKILSSSSGSGSGSGSGID